MKFGSWAVIPKASGGVNKRNMTIAKGTIEIIINGYRRPHLVCVLSEIEPIKGSFILFHTDHIMKAMVIKTTLSPTIVK